MIIEPNSIASFDARATGGAAISAANIAQAGKILPDSNNTSGIAATNSTTVELSQSMSLTNIAKKYDVQNMSPRDMVNMADDLQKAGAFSEEDALTLKFQPALNPNNNIKGAPGWASSSPDTPMNFISQWKSRLEFDQSIRNTANIAVDQKFTNLLGNLAALRESSSSQAISTSTRAASTDDFTNMTPNEMGKLVGDGKISGGFFMLTETQFQASMQVNSKGLTGTAREDVMDVANNTPANYIQLYTKGSKDSKMYGLDTTGLESILHQMEALQGENKQTKSLNEVA
ncbi:MAG: hypothetical protein WC504_09395 [Methylobacter sp.]